LPCPDSARPSSDPGAGWGGACFVQYTRKFYNCRKSLVKERGRGSFLCENVYNIIRLNLIGIQELGKIILCIAKKYLDSGFSSPYI
jgi:hypothetical protein